MESVLYSSSWRKPLQPVGPTCVSKHPPAGGDDISEAHLSVLLQIATTTATAQLVVACSGFAEARYHRSMRCAAKAGQRPWLSRYHGRQHGLHPTEPQDE